jgi:hypothetical protein
MLSATKTCGILTVAFTSVEKMKTSKREEFVK